MKIRQLNKKWLLIIAFVAVLIFSAIAPVSVYASTLYEYDCPDCTGGVIYTTSETDCAVSNCNNGIISVRTSSTCTTCLGTGQSYSFCSTCGGEKYYITEVLYNGNVMGYVLHGCEDCGGSGNHSSTSYNGFDWSGITLGSGYAPCSYCTNGIVYTTITSTCGTCGGDGIVTETTSEECTICEGAGSFLVGIENISKISTQIIRVGNTETVSFTFDTVGEIGDIEYYWYIDDVMCAMSLEPSLLIDIDTVGNYDVSCRIVPAVGYTYETDTFKVYVTNSIFGGSDTTDTDGGIASSDFNMNYVYIGIAVLVISVIAGIVIIKKRG